MKQTIFTLALILSMLPLGAVYHKIGEIYFPDPYGSASSVQVIGNMAYVTSYNTTIRINGLYIYHVSNPMNPVLIGSYSSGLATLSVTVVDNIAYLVVANIGLGPSSYMQVVDISNPQNPVLLGSCQLCIGDVARSVAISEGIAYLPAGMFGLKIVDVSNPSNPILLSTYDTPGSSNSVSVQDGVAYLADGESGLYALNIANPQNPILLSIYDTPGDAKSVSIAGSVAYLADGESGLQIINVTNPQIPALLGSYDTPGNAEHMKVAGSVAYIADGDSGLQTIDVSELQNPTLIGCYDMLGAFHVEVAGNNAYMINYSTNGVHIIDITNLQNISLPGSLDTPGYAHAVAVNGNITYVADGSSGLQIVDSSNPQNPTLLGTYDTAFEVNSLTVISGIAYVSGQWGYLIIDVSNPQNPSLLYDGENLIYPLYSFTVVDSLAYITRDSFAGPYFSILNVSDPQNPVYLGGGIDVSGKITVSGSIAYLYGWNLVLIDVSNPTNPFLIGSCLPNANISSLAINGNFAYAATTTGVLVIDASNPSTPVQVSTISLPHATSVLNYCFIHDNHLFVSDTGWNEISIYDISTPMSPVHISRYAWNLSTESMCVLGNVLYTANGINGLNIHDITTFPVDTDDAVQPPVYAFALRNYPNPFNPETTISYTLPAKGQVCLEIYNSKGQLIKRLLNEPQAKGEHSLTWNGKDDFGQSVASGLYLCRITSSGKQESRKLLLLK